VIILRVECLIFIFQFPLLAKPQDFWMKFSEFHRQVKAFLGKRCYLQNIFLANYDYLKSWMSYFHLAVTLIGKAIRLPQDFWMKFIKFHLQVRTFLGERCYLQNIFLPSCDNLESWLSYFHLPVSFISKEARFLNEI
jgi:hypothetical protein